MQPLLTNLSINVHFLCQRLSVLVHPTFSTCIQWWAATATTESNRLGFHTCHYTFFRYTKMQYRINKNWYSLCHGFDDSEETKQKLISDINGVLNCHTLRFLMPNILRNSNGDTPNGAKIEVGVGHDFRPISCYISELIELMFYVYTKNFGVVCAQK